MWALPTLPTILTIEKTWDLHHLVSNCESQKSVIWNSRTIVGMQNSTSSKVKIQSSSNSHTCLPNFVHHSTYSSLYTLCNNPILLSNIATHVFLLGNLNYKTLCNLEFLAIGFFFSFVRLIIHRKNINRLWKGPLDENRRQLASKNVYNYLGCELEPSYKNAAQLAKASLESSKSVGWCKSARAIVHNFLFRSCWSNNKGYSQG